MSSAAVRRASVADLPVVTRLLAEFRDWWGKSAPADAEIGASVERIHAGGDGEYLIGFGPGGDPAGVCQLRFRWSAWTGSHDCWLEDLYVAERARRSGLGRALVDACLERARERGCARIELDVNEDNAAALALYEACGFSRTPKGDARTLFVSRRLNSA